MVAKARASEKQSETVGVADGARERGEIGSGRDDAQSGALEVALLTLPAGSRVGRADLRVAGDTFQGLLAKLAGAKVSQSSVIYDSDGKTTGPTGGETAFLVDFGTSVSV